ncbi:MAG: hypothetical protein IJ388_00550 [Oscillospiraceae bacterium]|nr:hypothetical protein [Oscillospiraceae bacterium]
MLYPNNYYTNVKMTGEPVENTIIKVQSLYPKAAIDNNNGSELCSYPVKFNELYDNYIANGSTGNVKIPCCVIDLALGGDPVEIAAFGMTLRKYFDCLPLHIKIQVATDAAATNWVTVYEQDDVQWVDLITRWTFDPIDAYQVRFLALDLDEVDTLQEDSEYFGALLGDETRFCYAEVDVYTLNEGGSTSGGSTTKPTTGGSQAPTRPGIQAPTRPGQSATQAPTQKPTQATTQAPTQTPTQKPTTQDATQSPTQAPTQAPTTNAGQTTTVAPTVAPTENPSAPTVEPTVDPSAPTVDPSAPTETTPVEPTEGEPTVTPTEGEPTQAPTTEATAPTTDNGEEEKPNNSWIIIVAIVAVAAVVGGAVFFIIKKKRG